MTLPPDICKRRRDSAALADLTGFGGTGRIVSSDSENKRGLCGMESGFAAAALVAHELALFAALGFAIFGVDDLIVDLIWIARTAWRRAAVYTRFARADATTLGAPACPGAWAILVPAWDEADVIGAMLGSTLGRLRHRDYRIYVGCYPNDPATLKIVRAIAAADDRVRPAVTPRGIM